MFCRIFLDNEKSVEYLKEKNALGKLLECRGSKNFALLQAVVQPSTLEVLLFVDVPGSLRA